MSIKATNFDTPKESAGSTDSAGESKDKEINVNVSDSERDIINKALKDKQIIQRNRAAFERQWLVNIAFLYGRHFFTVERNPKPGLEERLVWELKQLDYTKKIRKSVNYILPLYRTLLSRMLQFKQQVNVDPTTREQRDISAARVAQEALEDFWQNVNKSNPILEQEYSGMMLIQAKLFGFMLALGKGYLTPWFNPKSKAKFKMDTQPNVAYGEIGAVEVEVNHPFNVFTDNARTWRMKKKVLNVDTIEDIYNIRVPSEELGMSEIERQLIQMLEGGEEEKWTNCAEVYERYELPSKDHPNGRMYIFTKSAMLEKPQDLPAYLKGRFPDVEYSYLDFFFAQPQGVVEQLIPSQEEYNHTVSRLHEYKKWFAGKVLVPDGCQLSAAYNDNVGQMIKYNPAGGKPEFDAPPNPPSFLNSELMRIRRDMEDIASVHDTSQGRVPAGVKSGQAIENLSELDLSQMSPILMHVEQQHALFCEKVLNIMEEKYSIPRLIAISGKQLTADVMTFKGKDVAGNRRIVIHLGNSLPVSRSARQERILLLADKGYITKEKALELLEFGNIEGITGSLDESAERVEIQEMLKGAYVEPAPWENHQKRIKVITDFMLSEDFVELRKRAQYGMKAIPQSDGTVQQVEAPANQEAQVVENFIQHRDAHLQMLQEEMRAAGNMSQGGQPAQPAPQPQPAG